MASHDHSDAPPPYSSSFEYTVNEKSDTEFVLSLQAAEPGFAVSSILCRGLQVPSSTAACSSGFDYPDDLTRYDITQENRRQFTQAIQDEAKLSRQQCTTVIGKGLGALAIGGLMIGFLGAIPALLVVRTARKRQEQRNVVASMAGEPGGTYSVTSPIGMKPSSDLEGG